MTRRRRTVGARLRREQLAGWGRVLAICLILLSVRGRIPVAQTADLPLATSTLQDGVHLPLIQNGRGWTDCRQCSFGTMLIQTEPGASIMPADVLIDANDRFGVKGMAGAGAPSDLVRDEWFGQLPGWTRSFMRGTYETLTPIHAAATLFGMKDGYECLGYGPETAHSAGDEALAPRYWVPRAKALADTAGKCLIYGPAVRDYERLAELERLPNPSSIVADVAPHVDVWMIQLAKYQTWADGGRDEEGDPYTMADFGEWIAAWVSWIKVANPNAQVWTQLGIGRYDPIKRVCLPPQPPEYILDYREVLARAGVDGVWVMPSQSCMPCPPTPSPDFICSRDPQDNQYYRESLATFQLAIEIACGGQ
jgi:hypothetical protein